MRASKWISRTLTSCIAFFIMGGALASAPHFLRGAGKVLRGPAAERVLSRLLGVSATRLPVNLEERGELLARELEGLKDSRLATDIKALFLELSEGRVGVETEVEGLLARIPNKTVSADDFLNEVSGIRPIARETLIQRDTRQKLLPEVYSFVKMIPIPVGRNFTMGSPEGEAGRHTNENQVEVELSPFEIMDAPVTQELWVKVMGENPSHFTKWRHCWKNHKVIGGISLCPDLPVESVSWDDVQKFIQRLNQRLGLASDKGYRLPTEAEWEFAARGGTTTAYFFGDDPRDLKKFAAYNHTQPLPVRSKIPNDWGLHDVHGNVREWVQDSYRERLIGGKDPRNTPKQRDSGRILRGGGWDDYPRLLRSAHRVHSFPSYRGNYHGFRLARSR